MTSLQTIWATHFVMLLPLVLKSPDNVSIKGPESRKCISEF